MNSVVGLARLLADPDGDPLTDEQRHQVGLINEAGSTLLALINELLDTAKAESGSLRPRFAPVDLPLLLARLHGTVDALARSADVELVVDHQEGLPALVTDEVMLLRVLRNLLSNALKFTERGACASTCASRDAPAARRLGHRDRHPAHRAGQGVRGLLPGAWPAPDRRGRHRPRPALRAAAGRHPRRRPRPAQHAR
ncbi:HAMP domain-containing histidine kinase [Saccharothrix sp. MB29]|nr:HAMP domain-containing histidine kinase [Saccharothrix sp. MB29]